MENIKKLPTTASHKLSMIRFIEQRHAEKIVAYCEFLGFDEKLVEKMKAKVDFFKDNGGYSLSIRVTDYEKEINLIDLNKPTYNKEDLTRQ